MEIFLNLLLYPRQRLKHVQRETDGLSDAVMRLYELDLSKMDWAGRREGVLARFEGGVHPEMLARIPSAKLDCTALLLYLREGGGWGYQLCSRGTVEDAFEAMPEGSASPDPASPEQHAARLARRFPAEREKLLTLLTQETPKADGFYLEILEAFLGLLAPWAQELLISDQLAPAGAVPAPDFSSPHGNVPDRPQPAPPPEPRPEACLSFLSGVRTLRRGLPFPLSLLYKLFPKKSPKAEDIPYDNWGLQELEKILERFYQGELAQLELEFTLHGRGAYVRRLGKTVYQPYRLTLELIREGQRCMCLLLDDQQPTVYRLIADREPYMNVDIKDLKKTVFHGQSVEEYTVFSASDLTLLRREVLFLLARLDCRESALSATTRMGVWSCAGLRFNRDQHQGHRDIWCLRP